MSSPIKLDAKLSELKAADVRLLIYGTLCNDGKIDFEKLATLAGMKKTSAHTNYWRAKKHLEQILNANPVSPTQIARPQPEGGDADSPKAVRSGKRGAAKDGSIKKTEPAKRRKTDTKTVSELVESTQTEDTAETTPADTTDQAE
ncbi:hypothetical protein PCG10_000242 [Penicillium crustosum]|uniref:Uncharacterized protein n=1 Tax=Penicillium crustosum TaxID=36656 RepID=A0A9P5L4B2_PENCR|nr:uncharacterized protein N7487_007837 [Penicillium crustosum]KAF7530732.1 hypothetical protein PCG10_000242 [Penicillium crustosum]KAJ5401941.1 hypothetical protein N7487_007837 [Penicillium crustosum]